jgi:hypothetical protein
LYGLKTRTIPDKKKLFSTVDKPFYVIGSSQEPKVLGELQGGRNTVNGEAALCTASLIKGSNGQILTQEIKARQNREYISVKINSKYLNYIFFPSSIR